MGWQYLGRRATNSREGRCSEVHHLFTSTAVRDVHEGFKIPICPLLKSHSQNTSKHPCWEKIQFLQKSTATIETGNQFYIRSSPSCWKFECLIKSSIYSFQDRTGLTFAQLILHIPGFISRKITHISDEAGLRFWSILIRDALNLTFWSGVTKIVPPFERSCMHVPFQSRRTLVYKLLKNIEDGFIFTSLSE